jgi:catechol 2,3-dioxygenase
MTFHMPPSAHLAGLTLRVRDLEAALVFYRDLLGLRVAARNGDQARLEPEGGTFTLHLAGAPRAVSSPAPSLGLYHFALLLPDRAALSAILRRLLEARWPLDGASDHGVSEALYVRDPEGNGLELARDRSRDTWPRDGGTLAMVSAPLNVEGLLAESPASAPLHPHTRLGHVHLSVDDLGTGEAFYAGGLGLTVTQRSYQGALFFAAGDYHHHLGLNIWGAHRRAPQGATGLLGYAWAVPEGTVEFLERHLTARGILFERNPSGLTLTDPIGVAVTVNAA